MLLSLSVVTLKMVKGHQNWSKCQALWKLASCKVSNVSVCLCVCMCVCVCVCVYVWVCTCVCLCTCTWQLFSVFIQFAFIFHVFFYLCCDSVFDGNMWSLAYTSLYSIRTLPSFTLIPCMHHHGNMYIKKFENESYPYSLILWTEHLLKQCLRCVYFNTPFFLGNKFWKKSTMWFTGDDLMYAVDLWYVLTMLLLIFAIWCFRMKTPQSSNTWSYWYHCKKVPCFDNISCILLKWSCGVFFLLTMLCTHEVIRSSETRVDGVHCADSVAVGDESVH